MIEEIKHNPTDIEKFLNRKFKCKRCRKMSVRRNPDTELFECANRHCKARFTIIEITKP